MSTLTWVEPCLGSQPCYLVDGTKTREIYGSDVIRERHRHRYEVNNTLVPQLEAKGMTISGWSQDQGLVEMIELADHPGLSLASSTQNSRLARAADIHCSQVSSMRQLRGSLDELQDGFGRRN